MSNVALYTMEWSEQSAAGETQPDGSELWCVLLDDTGVGDQVLELARGAGLTCIGVRRSGARGDRQDGGDGIPADTRSAFRAGLVDALRTPGHVNVVYLWALDAGGPEHPQAEALASARVADLVSVLAVDAEVGSSSLWLVTRGAQCAVDSGPAGLQPALWGLGRCVRFEHPELGCRRLDLDPHEDDARADALRVFDEVIRSAGAGEDEVAFRGGRRLVPRLRELHAPLGAKPFAPRAEATYLVTGGLGLLGLKVVEWLSARGAGRLEIVSRREPTARARRLIESLRDAGTQITLHEADVSDERAVRELVQAAGGPGFPLSGVFHLAGDFGDSDILDLTEEELRTVMAGRAHGAHHLDQATRRLPLEAFVMFGSSVAALGAPGQGAFAASNAVLSSIAAERRRLGHAALCVLWGPWAYGALDGGGALSGLEPAEALEVLAGLVPAGRPEVMALPQKLHKLLAFYPRAAAIAAFSELVDPDRLSDPGYTRRETARAYQPPRDRLERVVISVVRRVLALDKVGVHDDFFELGGDSVTGAAILDRVNRLLGTTITFEDAIEAFTAEQLASHARAQMDARAASHEATHSSPREAAVRAG